MVLLVSERDDETGELAIPIYLLQLHLSTEKNNKLSHCLSSTGFFAGINFAFFLVSSLIRDTESFPKTSNTNFHFATNVAWLIYLNKTSFYYLLMKFCLSWFYFFFILHLFTWNNFLQYSPLPTSWRYSIRSLTPGECVNQRYYYCSLKEQLDNQITIIINLAALSSYSNI